MKEPRELGIFMVYMKLGNSLSDECADLNYCGFSPYAVAAVRAELTPVHCTRSAH